MCATQHMVLFHPHERCLQIHLGQKLFINVHEKTTRHNVTGGLGGQL